MRRTVTFALSLGLAACTVGRNYTPPEVHTPAAFQEASGVITTRTTSATDLSCWWDVIPDPELHKLLDQALKQNLDLRSAQSRVVAARQQEVIAGAAGRPQLSANALAAKLHSGSNPLARLGGGSSNASASQDTTIDLYSLGFDATWEIDLFGGVRRQVEAARANTEAAVWQMRDGEVSLTAEIANDYLGLRFAQARMALLREEMEAQDHALHLAEARLRAGFATALDVNQQKGAAATTAAQVPLVETQIRAFEHALAVMMAEEPETLVRELDAGAPVPPLPEALPVGLPSDLLRRRPDVRAAERKLAAATAEEGAAIASLYPRFNLLGALSLASGALGKLFSDDSFSQIVAGQVAWPLFTGGKVHANIRAKHQEELQAYLAYQAAVLKAIQDSEDALLRYKKDELRVIELTKADDAARSSYEISLRQYRSGLIAFVTVLTAQNQSITAQDALVQGRQAIAQDLISVFKALGGGWSSDEPEFHDPLPPPRLSILHR